MTTGEQLEILKSNTCHCGALKQQQHAFCYRCYSKLSTAQQDSLYIRVPDFGISYERCLQVLKGRKVRHAG